MSKGSISLSLEELTPKVKDFNKILGSNVLVLFPFPLPTEVRISKPVSEMLSCIFCQPRVTMEMCKLEVCILVLSPEHKMLMCKQDSVFSPITTRQQHFIAKKKGFLYKCIPKERGGGGVTRAQTLVGLSLKNTVIPSYMF